MSADGSDVEVDGREKSVVIVGCLREGFFLGIFRIFGVGGLMMCGVVWLRLFLLGWCLLILGLFVNWFWLIFLTSGLVFTLRYRFYDPVHEADYYYFY